MGLALFLLGWCLVLVLLFTAPALYLAGRIRALTRSIEALHNDWRRDADEGEWWKQGGD